METTAYYAFGVPLYIALTAGEAWLQKRRGKKTLDLPTAYGNITAGLGTIVLGLFLGPLLLALYDAAYDRIALVQWHGSAFSWLLAFVLADFGHYCHHRLDHRFAAAWAVHGVHHQPESMNYTVAMRHAWFSDLYSFPFYVWCPLAGVTSMQFFIATTALSVHALITHSEEIHFPSLFIFVTPRSHTLHHAKNPRYIDKNFGAMFCVWDRLFGTHVIFDPSDPPNYGADHGYGTHNGVKAQWVLWSDLVARIRDEGLSAAFSRPKTHTRSIPAAMPRMRTQLIVAALFTVIVPFSLWLFVLRDDHPLGLRLLSAVAIITGIYAGGARLDRDA